MVKVGIIGVRDLDGSLYTDRTYVENSLFGFLDKNDIVVDQLKVFTGGGRGVEQLVVEWCEDQSVDYRKIPPNIAKYGGKQAFVQRNNEILSRVDTVLVFWDGYMDVTQEAIASAIQRGMEVHIFPIV